jgi:membrane protease YdiL (CAAX protease family)
LPNSNRSAWLRNCLGTCSHQRMLFGMPWDFWLIFIVLGVFLPWRGRRRIRKLLALPEVTGRERIRLYLSTILFQWVLTALIGWRAFSRGFGESELGLSAPWTPKILLITFAGAILIALGHWLNLRRMAGISHPSMDSLRAMAKRIFPRSGSELLVFLLLALTAGVCEEFIFRGFVIAALSRAQLATWEVILWSSLMFGAAHLYQGKGGSIGTGLLGVVLAGARIAYHSLLPVMVWHAVLDVVAGIAGAKYLTSKTSPEAGILIENRQ